MLRRSFFVGFHNRREVPLSSVRKYVHKEVEKVARDSHRVSSPSDIDSIDFGVTLVTTERILWTWRHSRAPAFSKRCAARCILCYVGSKLPSKPSN